MCEHAYQPCDHASSVQPVHVVCQQLKKAGKQPHLARGLEVVGDGGPAAQELSIEADAESAAWLLRREPHEIISVLKRQDTEGEAIRTH